MKVSGKLCTDVQGHTLELHSVITRLEAEHICRKYNVQFSSLADIRIEEPMLKGINRVAISPKPRFSKAGEELLPAFDMSVVVNIRRAIGLSGMGMAVLSKENVQRMIKGTDKELAKLGLLVSHGESGNWYIKRLDAGFDVRLGTDDPKVMGEYMRMLHYSFNPDIKGYGYSRYRGHDSPDVMQESVTIQNKSGRYNIYRKLVQLEKLYPGRVSDEVLLEMADVLRIEKQLGVIESNPSINAKGLESAIGTPRTAGRLLDSAVTEKLARSVIQDMKQLFGTGDYVTFQEGIQIIRDSGYSEEVRHRLERLYLFTNNSGGYARAVRILHRLAQKDGPSEDFCTFKKQADHQRKQIEQLGISVVASRIGCRLDGIVKLLENEARKNRKPRSKGAFGKITAYPQPSGKQRYKCNATLHTCDGAAITKSLTGKVGASYDESDYQILGKIVGHIKTERAKCQPDKEKAVAYMEVSMGDIENYRTLEHSEDMIWYVDDVLDQMKRYLEKWRQ